MNHFRNIVQNYSELAAVIRQGGFRHVLLGSYAEYLAAILERPASGTCAGAAIVFGAIVHDPVRDYVVGPRWWHRRSVASAFSFLKEAFVHEAIDLDTVRPMPNLRTTVIPHGPYHFSKPKRSRDEVRRN